MDPKPDMTIIQTAARQIEDLILEWARGRGRIAQTLIGIGKAADRIIRECDRAKQAEDFFERLGHD